MKHAVPATCDDIAGAMAPRGPGDGVGTVHGQRSSSCSGITIPGHAARASARAARASATSRGRSLSRSAPWPHAPGCSTMSQRRSGGAVPASGSPSASDCAVHGGAAGGRHGASAYASANGSHVHKLGGLAARAYRRGMSEHTIHPGPHDHVHGPGCGHTAIQHGDHVDYLVDGHLHHPHGDHCDDHGAVELA